MNESEMKAGPSGTKSGLNGFEPWFAFPKFALPGVFRELAEQGVARTQDGCEKIKVASEKMAEVVRDSYSTSAKGATDYGLKVIEISNANSASAIDFFADLLRSKSMTDVVSLSAAQARKTFHAASNQNKELWGIAQKLATETGEPIRKHIAEVLDAPN